MKLKDLYKRYHIAMFTILGIVGVFLLWYVIALLAKTTLLPGPEIVLPIFFSLFIEGNTYLAIGGTLLRLIIAIALGSIFGLILGIFGGLYPSFRAFIKPLIIILRTIPTAAVIFIIIALLRPMFAPVIIVFLVTFPILYESVVSGISNIDSSIIDASKIDGSNDFKSVFKLYLPLSKSYILLGLVSSIGLGMKVSIMSEILAGSESEIGLGKMIQNAATIADMKNVLAYSLIAVIIIGLIDLGMHFIKKRLSKEVVIKDKKNKA